MENFIEELSKVDFLDIYDDIAAIPLTNAQLVEFCEKCPCKVDLSRGNVVYAVEQKYKAKLSTYSKPKILKWLKAKLPKIVPNPEEKILKWQQKHQPNAKREWLLRKCEALGDLPPPFSGSSDSELSEESLIDEPQSSKAVVENKRRLSQLSSCSTQVTNSTGGTVETVIPSQPKSIGDSLSIRSNFAALINCSHSDIIASGELPPLFSNSVSCSEAIEAEPREATKHSKALPPGPKSKQHRTLLYESEEMLSQTDPYASFTAENIVSSTQEFGY